jgi:pyruvate dehydrogenase E2 component (dihydrolipoamide acetyltransferase)
MAEIVRMPKMSDTMTEGVIAKWHKKVGDTVKSGELMAEIETDKATMDYESFNAGTVLFLGAEEGQAIQVNDVLAVVGNSGEDFKELLAGAGQAAQTGGKAEPKAEPKTEPKTESKPEPKTGEKATPAPSASPAVDTSNIKAEIVLMPKMSDTMTDGVIAAWHKKVGDSVKTGELLAEIETDKATMEYESYNAGTLLYIGADAGKSVPVNGVLAVIGEQGADWETLLKAHESKSSSPPAPETKGETKDETKSEPAPVQANAGQQPVSAEASGGRVKASPLAKKLAKDKGFDIAKIQGSGDLGRITKKDVENFKPSAEPAPAQKAGVPVTVAVGQESFEEVNVSQMRKTIARRLGEIKFSAIEIFLTMEINMDRAIEARNSINEVAPVKVSFNDMVIKAVAAALKSNPKVNSSWLGDKIRYNHHVHIGVAVAVDEGLVVPVIRFADSLGLAQISATVKDFAGKAKNKKLQPAEMEGSTFTVSNLGMFGIEQFTAVINPPNACILAIGGIKQTAIVKNGQLVPGNVMNVTLTCDHRVVDGAVGAAFLQSLKGLLEDPVRILI